MQEEKEAVHSWEISAQCVQNQNITDTEKRKSFYDYPVQIPLYPVFTLPFESGQGIALYNINIYMKVFPAESD